MTALAGSGKVGWRRAPSQEVAWVCGRAGDGVAASPWASVWCGWQLVEAVAVRPGAAVSFNTRAGGGLAASLLFLRPSLAQLVGVASPFGGEL